MLRLKIFKIFTMFIGVTLGACIAWESFQAILVYVRKDDITCLVFGAFLLIADAALMYPFNKEIRSMIKHRRIL